MATIKLSEAIMMNGMTKPQGFGDAAMYSDAAPCALGGALQVMGAVRRFDVVEDLWPWVKTKPPNGSCHICAMPRADYIEAIWHLNDHHRLTRAQIAEWVATVEPKDCALCGQPEGDHAHDGLWCPNLATSKNGLFNYHQKFTASLTAPLETAIPVQG